MVNTPYSGKWFHLRRGDLVMNGYQPCWFLRTISFKQTHLAPVSYKDSAWNFYIHVPFKFGQDCFVEVCIFCVCIFVLVRTCPMPYLMISNTFNKENRNIILIIQTGHLKFASGVTLVTKRLPNDFFNLEPWMYSKCCLFLFMSTNIQIKLTKFVYMYMYTWKSTQVQMLANNTCIIVLPAISNRQNNVCTVLHFSKFAFNA